MHAYGLLHYYLQAAGVTDRSLVDRIADTLEMLHVKRTPPVKALARDIAEKAPHIDVEGEYPVVIV